MTNLLRNSNSRGAALLTVLVAMMIITILLLEFQYRSMVEQKLAFNDLDQLKAYYLAKSGANIGLLRLSLYGRATSSPVIKQLSQNINIKPYLDMIWSLPFPPFPPEQAKLGSLLKADKDAATTLLEQTRLEDGQFSQTIVSQSSKININNLVFPKPAGVPVNSVLRVDLNKDPENVQEQTGRLLVNLMARFIAESDDPYEEFGDLKPDEIVYNIIDWVNTGTESVLGGLKDSWYEGQDPPYRTKKHRFYTIEELKLVKGMDDTLFRKLRPHITVYSYDGRININTARQDILKALYPDFTDKDLELLLEERTRVGSWSTEKAFVTYVTDNLGRSDFERYYPDPNNYPFGVGHQSFLVDSLGIVKKSASQIQRSIKTAVAFVSESQGGDTVPGVGSQKDCKAPNFWDPRANRCRFPPTSGDECLNKFAGEWKDINGKMCCEVLGPRRVICPASDGGGGSAAKPADVPPNGMKILHWAEI